MITEHWITSIDIRIGRIKLILHRKPYWGNLVRSWGINTNSAGLLWTPFGSLYYNGWTR